MPEYEDEFIPDDDDFDDSVAERVYQLTLPEKTADFICAGNSCFTLLSEKSGKTYSYRVKKARGSIDNHSAPLFVYVMNGRNKIRAHDYIGTITGENIGSELPYTIEFTPRRSMVMMPALNAFKYMITHLKTYKMPPNCQIWQSGRCCRCNRLLTDPKSIRIGYGIECVQQTDRFKRRMRIAKKAAEGINIDSINTLCFDLATRWNGEDRKSNG